MNAPSYAGYRFPRDIIQRAVWMYLRFTLSYRDVEELLAERDITVTYEAVRRWVLAFGPVIARGLRARRPRVRATASAAPSRSRGGPSRRRPACGRRFGSPQGRWHACHAISGCPSRP